MPPLASRPAQKISGHYKLLLLLMACVVLLYLLYVAGISRNPPGFYLDESGIAYNAYLIARTGADEAGTAWPLYVRLYTGGFGVYTNSAYIYLLAALYLLFPPSILVAKFLSATVGFAAALLLGFIAWRITKRRTVGIILALIAMFTPWLFELSRLVFEVALYPLALALFLLVLHRAQARERWSWLDSALLAATLALINYTYTIGRLFAPLLALGLIFFATNRARLIDVVKTWAAYGVTLIPLFIFNRRHPGALTERFYLISYIKPHSTWSEITYGFIRHYLDNLSLSSLLLVGDTNPRHHISSGGGSFFAAVFVLALIGLYLVIKNHWRDPWWRFIIYGLAISLVPASLTLDQFHTLRMIPYPVFLLLLTAPALAWLIDGRDEHNASQEETKGKKKEKPKEERPDGAWSFSPRRKALILLLALTILQAVYFQVRFHKEGPMRGVVFDAGYVELYKAALSQTSRPIYLVDGMWGPAYIHSFWYATLEGKSTSEFIHLNYGQRPPAGALVISSEDKCTNCQIILRRDQYMLYRAL